MIVHRVCTFLTLLLLAGYAAFMCASIPASSVTPPRPRFEQIYQEELKGGTYSDVFTVYHDRESGNEIVCIHLESCWVTGRTW